MMGKKCILFCRVSTSAQDWERQRDCLRANALRDGYTDEDIITIGHKESGYKLDEDERKGLQELERYLKSGDVECTYVWEISRLARKPKVLYEIRDKFKEYGVQLKCDKPSFVLLTEDLKEFDTSSTIVFSIFAALAEQEIFLKKARFADGKQKNAKRNRYNGGNIPFGYTLRDDKTFEINEEEAKIIHEVFDLYEEGYSIAQIVRTLKEKYIGGRFRCTLSFVHNILTSELLTGESHEDKEIVSIIKGKERKWHLYSRQYPRIITIEQYQHCRNIAVSNSTNADKTRTIYYANRIFRCPSCGRFMVGVGNRCIYQCYDAHNKNRALNGYDEATRCQDKRTFSINVIDTILWQCGSLWEAMRMMNDLKSQKEQYLISIQEIEHKIAIAQQRIKESEAKKTRIMDDYYEGRLSKENYIPRIESVQQDVNAIKAECLSYEHEIEQLQKLIEIMDVDDAYKRELNGRRFTYDFNSEQWNAFMQRIESIVDDDKRYEIVHKNVKSIEVSEEEITHSFGVGQKKIKVRFYTVSNFNNDRAHFYVVSNTGHGAEIYITNSVHITCALNEPIFPVIIRFEDKDKKKRRVKQRALKNEQQARNREGKFTVKELMEQSGWTYGEIHYAIAHKGLKAQKEGKEYLIAERDWDEYCKQLYVRKK